MVARWKISRESVTERIIKDKENIKNKNKEEMKSILVGRPALKAVVYQIAEVTGYLWQKGWAERNGGNITVNVTEYMDA